jgi:peptidoglycan/LPS O-acetylase OafA/YrhL
LVFWNESGYFDNASDTKPLLHLWSLGIEEQFYFAWPILVFLVWKRRVNLLWLGLAMAIISFAINVYEVHHELHFTAAFYSPITRFWELMIGAILAYITLDRKKTFALLGVLNSFLDQARINHYISILGFALLVFGAALINKESSFPGYWALLPTLGSAFLIAAGPHACINRILLSNRLLVWIGLISFPLYLWHWPLLSFAHILQGQLPSAEIRALMLIASIVLSALTYYHI